MDAKGIWISANARANYSSTYQLTMIPNLSNAATSNSDYYKKKKKKKEEAPKYKGNRANIPNLSNAAKSNKDLYANKDKSKSSKTKTKLKPGKKYTKAQLRFKQREAEGKSGLTGGKKGEKISEYYARQKKRTQEAAGKKNTDYKKVKSGEMSKEQFAKKYPRSNTAQKLKSSKPRKTSEKKATKAFNKKHGITDKDNRFSKFAKSGGVAGWINRKGKKIRSMSADDLRINKKKKKK